MNLKKIVSLSLGLVVLATVAVLTGTGTVGASPHLNSLIASPPPPSVPVNVVNTPLPVSGSVNATVTGNVNATLTNSSVTVTNAAATPVLVRDVDNGHNPYELELTLTNDTTDYGPTNSTCNGPPVSTQCQVSFTVPAGQRYVVEHVSAFIVGPTGQTYTTFLSGNVSEFLVMTKQLSASGLDSYTASQPMRVYENPGRFPPASVSVDSSVGGNFFARVTISGYLVPLP